MHRIALTALFIATAALAQDVRFDYDRSANFGSYKTYQWVHEKPLASGDQLIDQDIKRAVDSQLAGKGLRRVETGGDLQIRYQAAISKEKQFDGFGWGPRGLGGFETGRVTTSTIETGTLVIEVFDPSASRLVWRGSASKTLELNKDPDKNYRNLEKAMSKLFRNYPPHSGKN